MEDLARAVWLRRLIVTALLAGLVLLAFQVLQPFIVPVIWAGILAFVTWPMYERVLRWVGGRRALAASLMTGIMIVAILLPLVWLVFLLQTEALAAYQRFVAMLARGPMLPDFVLNLPVVGPWIADQLARVAENPAALGETLRDGFERWFGQFGSFVGGVGRNIVKMAIALFSLFFMYRDGPRLADEVSQMLSQFMGPRVVHYVAAIGDTVKAVVYGLVLAALAQGTLAGFGYWGAGLEAPVFLGALTALVALIPFVVPFMWGGASLWLLLTGNTVEALGLFLWGLIAVSWIDNLVRPLVISGATRIPFLLVMFGVLGGLAAFGLVGLFIGPVILGIIVAIWREWLAEKRAAEIPDGDASQVKEN
jgi:predicted PurR-regulated permease PerM